MKQEVSPIVVVVVIIVVLVVIFAVWQTVAKKPVPQEISPLQPEGKMSVPPGVTPTPPAGKEVTPVGPGGEMLTPPGVTPTPPGGEGIAPAPTPEAVPAPEKAEGAILPGGAN